MPFCRTTSSTSGAWWSTSVCGLHPDPNLKQNWFPLSSSPSPTSLSRGRARGRGAAPDELRLLVHNRSHRGTLRRSWRGTLRRSLGAGEGPCGGGGPHAAEAAKARQKVVVMISRRMGYRALLALLWQRGGKSGPSTRSLSGTWLGTRCTRTCSTSGTRGLCSTPTSRTWRCTTHRVEQLHSEACRRFRTQILPSQAIVGAIGLGSSPARKKRRSSCSTRPRHTRTRFLSVARHRWPAADDPQPMTPGSGCRHARPGRAEPHIARHLQSGQGSGHSNLRRVQSGI